MSHHFAGGATLTETGLNSTQCQVIGEKEEKHGEPQGVEKMGLRIPLGIQILCGRFFPPTLGKVPTNAFGLHNLNLATFDGKKSQFFTMPLPFF